MKSTKLRFERARELYGMSIDPRGTEPLISDDGTKATRPLNLLLLATQFQMPYRVMRCAYAAGAKVFVLGAERAGGLRHSRYCAKFLQADCPIDGTTNAELARTINSHIKLLNIDMVLAGDALSTRSLIAIGDMLHAPRFPMPDLARFDFLNDKWQFHLLCKSLGIPTPNSRLFSRREELAREIDNLEFPIIAKPLSMDGGAGYIKIEGKPARKQLASIFYEPIIVQDFVKGQDIGASVYCERGEIRAFIAHRYYRAVYSTFPDDAICNQIAKLMRHLKIDGVFNFDMILTPDGQVFYLECNPRFYFKIAMTALAGINFVALGLPGRGANEPNGLADSVVVRFPKAMLATLHQPWKLDRISWSVLKFLFSDPVPYMREELGLENPAPECSISLPSHKLSLGAFSG